MYVREECKLKRRSSKIALLAGLLAIGGEQEEVKDDPLYDRLTLILDPLEQFASMLEETAESDSEVLVLENLINRAKSEIKKLTDALEEQAGGRIVKIRSIRFKVTYEFGLS